MLDHKRTSLLSALIFIILNALISVDGNGCADEDKNKLIQIGGDNYHLKILKTFSGSPPENVLFADNNIYYNIDNRTSVLRMNEDSVVTLKFHKNTQPRKSYIDELGNQVVSINKRTYFIRSAPTSKKIKIFTDYGSETDQMSVDMDRNRVFMLGYDISNPGHRGRLFYFDISQMKVVGGRLIPTEVKDLGDNIVAISVNRANGKLAVCRLINGKWTLSVLEMLDKFTCKTPPKKGIFKETLRSAIDLAKEEILRLYEDAVLGRDNSDILKRQQSVRFANGGPVKPSLDVEESSSTYSPNAVDETSVCGENFDRLTSELAEMEKTLTSVKTKFETLYTMIFNAKDAENLMEFDKKVFEKVTAVKLTDVDAAKKDKYVCLLEDEYKNVSDELTADRNLIKSTHNWIQFVNDKVDSDMIVDARFGQ